MHIKLQNSWSSYLQKDLKRPCYLHLLDFLDDEIAKNKTIFPKKSEMFNALNNTPPEDVKVVIVGQDPYPTVGHAHGLSFSVLPNVKLPKSLINIYKELQDDLGIDNFHTGYLMPWARQGVLLLNSVLSVESGKANSHQGRGWEPFTDAVLKVLNERHKHLVFILWGNYAQKKGAFLDENKHLIIASPHPSPLSSYRGFFGSKPFSKANHYLKQHNKVEVNWQIKNDFELV